MNKEQLKQNYRRFRSWQEAGPHYKNRHENTVQHCHNCGTEFSGNFCPRCGQRAELGRVGWKSIKENVAMLWGMDSRSFAYTLFQLLTRPGYLIRDYISGRRQVSFPPVKMLVIVSLFTIIFESLFHLENDVLTLHFDKVSEKAGMDSMFKMFDSIIKWFNDNKSWGTLFYQSFFILPTWVVFRFAPGYPRHTLPEGFFLQVFLSTLSLVLSFLDYVSSYAEYAENVIATIYFIIVYHQIFGYGWWGTLWRFIATALSAMLIMGIPVVVLIWVIFSKQYEEDYTEIMAGLTVAPVVSLAVILYVSYRISRPKKSESPDN